LRSGADRSGVIIIACVDDSGSWGRGGFFTALSNLSPRVAEAYERAGEFSDLKLGSAHIIRIDELQDEANELSPSISSSSSQGVYVCLLITQTRRSGQAPSGIQHAALIEALNKTARFAQQHRLSIHSPRLGWGAICTHVNEC
jgi:hypothetical protein